MSNKILDAVCKLVLGNSTDKLLLVMLANHADEQGRCRPGIPLLARETDLGRRTIFDSLKRLQAAGYVQVIHRHRHSNVFQLVLSAAAAPQSAAAAPRTLIESSLEPSRNPKRGGEPLKTVGEMMQQREMPMLQQIRSELGRRKGNA